MRVLEQVNKDGDTGVVPCSSCARFSKLIWPCAGTSERRGGGGQGLVLCQAKLLERAEG